MSSRGLEGVSIDRPCPKRWAELVGDERRRFCSACSLHVTNLSALTRTEAEGFLAASTGRVCVTYVPTEAGRVSLRSEGGAPRRFTRHLAAAASFLLGLVCLLPGCRPTASTPDSTGGPPDPDETRAGDTRLLGGISADPVCQVDEDQRMIMGEMVARDPSPPPQPDAEHGPVRE